MGPHAQFLCFLRGHNPRLGNSHEYSGCFVVHRRQGNDFRSSLGKHRSALAVVFMTGNDHFYRQIILTCGVSMVQQCAQATLSDVDDLLR
jgi:hypothetical protein